MAQTFANLLGFAIHLQVGHKLESMGRTVQDSCKDLAAPNDRILDDNGSVSADSESNDSSRNKETDDANAGAPEEVISKKETQAVSRLRLVVLLVLVGAAAAVAATVYFYLTHSEEKQFLDQFEEDAAKIFAAVGGVIDQTMAAFDGIAVTMVSTAKMTNQTWPFVTIADFAVRLSKVLPLSHASIIGAYHILTPENREQWEEYTKNNDYWVNESMTVQKDWGGYYGPVEYNGEQNPVVHGAQGDLPANER
jgi:hypothetical protein